jgi:hypothetical protein
MALMTRVSVGAIILGVASCEVNYTKFIVTVKGSNELPLGYQVGDTVTFIAYQDVHHSEGEFTTADSEFNPSGYSWTSTEPAVMEMISPGRFHMLRTGHASITVTTTTSQSRTFNVTVVPPVASMRVVPTSASLLVGDSVVFDAEALDSSGAVIVEIKNAPWLITATNLLADRRYVATLDRGGPPFKVRAIATGRGQVVASLSVYRVAQPHDTFTVTVNAAAPPPVPR